MKSSIKNNLQCSQTCVKVMAPRPSVSSTTCLKKSVLFHKICSVKRLRASTSSNTWSQVSPISFLVHCGMKSSSNPTISEHFRHALQGILSCIGDPLVNHCRSVVFLAVKFLHIFPRPTVSRTPPETANSSFLLFKSSFNSFVASMTFHHLLSYWPPHMQHQSFCFFIVFFFSSVLLFFCFLFLFFCYSFLLLVLFLFSFFSFFLFFFFLFSFFRFRFRFCFFFFSFFSFFSFLTSPCPDERPPDAVFKLKSMAVWAHVRHCNSSLPCNLCDAPPQEVRALLRDLLHGALALIVILPRLVVALLQRRHHRGIDVFAHH